MVSLAAFNINVESPSISVLPEEFYSVNIVLVPLWGLYANLIAQLLTQLSSHIIIHYHRKVTEMALDRTGSDGANAHSEIDAGEESHMQHHTRHDLRAKSPSEELHQHSFCRPHRGEKDTLRIRNRVNSMLIAIAAVLGLLIFFGCVFPSFSFEELGLLGIAVEFGRGFEEAKNEFSVFSLAKTLVNQGSFLGTANAIIGMSVIATYLVLTVFIVPMLQVGALIYQWFVRMKQDRRGRLEVGIEILSSWQYVEVYLVAVVASCWQIGPTSEYLINTYCEGLTDTFSSLVYYDILSEDDAQCFRLRGTVKEGCFILIVVAFLLAFINTFVTRAVFQYQRDKDEEERRRYETPNPDAMTQRLSETVSVEEAIKKIRPTPVLFTDTFRWLLQSKPTPGKQSEMGGSDSDVFHRPHLEHHHHFHPDSRLGGSYTGGIPTTGTEPNEEGKDEGDA
jgi:hypothetical protein